MFLIHLLRAAGIEAEADDDDDDEGDGPYGARPSSSFDKSARVDDNVKAALRRSSEKHKKRSLIGIKFSQRLTSPVPCRFPPLRDARSILAANAQDYSYFDQRKLATLKGPQHWRLRRKAHDDDDAATLPLHRHGKRKVARRRGAHDTAEPTIDFDFGGAELDRTFMQSKVREDAYISRIMCAGKVDDFSGSIAVHCQAKNYARSRAR